MNMLLSDALSSVFVLIRLKPLFPQVLVMTGSEEDLWDRPELLVLFWFKVKLQ